MVSTSPSRTGLLARRLILGRYAPQIRLFASLWIEAGSSEASVECVASAIDRALSGWPGGELLLGDTGDYSAAHAVFVSQLNERVVLEDPGPIGNAVRGSRYSAGARLEIFLQGELGDPTGFPLVLRPESVTTEWQTRLAVATWVSSRLPVSAKGGGNAATGSDFQEDLDRRWAELARSIPGRPTQDGEGMTSIAADIPEALRLLVRKLGCDTLDSAGLGLTIQHQAELQGRSIPAGLGFSGRWWNERLKGVTGIAAKLRAVRDAGIFALFACVSANEPAIDIEPGVALVRLPENLPLEEVIVRINTLCHQIGLCEYRWRASVRRMTAGFAGAMEDRWLPNVAVSPSNCPVGFVGRDAAITKLDRWRDAADKFHGRQLNMVLGPPRSGKSTLLSHWLVRNEQCGEKVPIWFSFLREATSARGLAGLQDALTKQIEARHCVLFRPRPPPTYPHVDSKTWSRRPQAGSTWWSTGLTRRMRTSRKRSWSF